MHSAIIKAENKFNAIKVPNIVFITKLYILY